MMTICKDLQFSFAALLRILALSIALSISIGAPLSAQQTTDLSGTVSDASGGAIEAASVLLRRGGAVTAQTRTDASGRYTFAGLDAGTYDLEVSAASFTREVREVTIPASGDADIQLTVASLAESVTVTAQVDGYSADTATTGTKLALPRLRNPQSISVISREVMDDRVVTRLTETADHSASVRAQVGYGGTQSNNYSFRGFRAGLEANNTNLRNGFQEFAFLSQRDPANVERVEFIKGPASLLYGSAEVGGLVNTITKKPLAQHRYEFGLVGGGFGQVRPTIDLTGPVDGAGKLLYRFNGAYDRGGSYRDFVNHEVIFAAPAITWRPTGATALTFEVELGSFVNDFARGFPQNPLFLDVDPTRSFIEPWTRADNEQVNYMLNFTHQFSENWSMRSGFSHIRNETNIRAVSFGFFAIAPDGRTINRNAPHTDEKSRNWNSQNEIYGRVRTGSVEHQLVAGVEATRFQFKYLFDSLTLDPIDRINPVYGALPGFRIFGFNDDIAATQVGLYLQDQIRVTDRLSVMLGGRFSNVPSRRKVFPDGDLLNEQTDRDFLPRAGVSYRVVPGGNAYFSYATSFFPNFASRQRNDEPFNPTVGRQYEAGWKQQLARGRVLATFAYFDLTRADVLVPDPEDDTFTFSIQVGEQRSRGAEVEVNGRITNSLNVIATYGALDTEVTEDPRGFYLGDRLADAPTHSGSLYMNYGFRDGPLTGFSMGAGVYAGTSRFAALPNPVWLLPGRARADLNFGYERPHWRFDVTVKNLTNSRDFQSGSFNALMPTPTRHALASIKYRF